MTRRRLPTINGWRECCECHNVYPDTREWFNKQGRDRVDGSTILRADCRTCSAAHERELYASRVAGMRTDGPTPPNWSPPWTPPPADAAWGYCPRCGWAASNGAGPHACACGRQFTETVHPARVCESIRA